MENVEKDNIPIVLGNYVAHIMRSYIIGKPKGHIQSVIGSNQIIGYLIVLFTPTPTTYG